jgi:hypothetical protein
VGVVGVVEVSLSAGMKLKLSLLTASLETLYSNYSLLARWFLEIGIRRQNWDVGKTGGHCSKSRLLISPFSDTNSDNEFL